MLSRLILAAALTLAVGGAASAQSVLMDQIGPNPSYLVQPYGYTSQYSPNNQSNLSIATLDNFTVTGGATVTDVQGVFVGVQSFSGYNTVQSWQVDIYSSVAAATTSLTGDVASVNATPAQVGLTAPYGPSSESALVSIPVSIPLAAGNYEVAIIPTLEASQINAITEVYQSTYTGFPADNNAVQTNPGGGFSFPGNKNNLGVNVAYRILGNSVPEPDAIALIGLTILPLVASRRR